MVTTGTAGTSETNSAPANRRDQPAVPALWRTADVDIREVLQHLRCEPTGLTILDFGFWILAEEQMPLQNPKSKI